MKPGFRLPGGFVVWRFRFLLTACWKNAPLGAAFHAAVFHPLLGKCEWLVSLPHAERKRGRWHAWILSLTAFRRHQTLDARRNAHGRAMNLEQKPLAGFPFPSPEGITGRAGDPTPPSERGGRVLGGAVSQGRSWLVREPFEVVSDNATMSGSGGPLKFRSGKPARSPNLVPESVTCLLPWRSHFRLTAEAAPPRRGRHFGCAVDEILYQPWSL